jgi:hypothetical protein
LLDYGQVKDLPEQLRLGYANLVLAIADGDPARASESYRYCYSHTLGYQMLLLLYLWKIITEINNFTTAKLQTALVILLGINNGSEEEIVDVEYD